MDINEERRTELLWRRIVDLRSRVATVPLDDRGPEAESGELSELQRLADHTGEVMNGEIIQGRQAAHDRLVQFIHANPVSSAPRSKPRRDIRPRRASQRALLVLAILLFACAIAIAAVNYILPAYRDTCYTPVERNSSGSKQPSKASQLKALEKFNGRRRSAE